MKVCATTEDPLWDDCQWVPGVSDASSAPLSNLCAPGDAACLMTGKPALNLLKKPSAGLLENPIVLAGIAIALVVLLKKPSY
jgi:hypothetical protein